MYKLITVIDPPSNVKNAEYDRPWSPMLEILRMRYAKRGFKPCEPLAAAAWFPANDWTR